MIAGFAPYAVYWLISVSAAFQSQTLTSKTSLDSECSEVLTAPLWPPVSLHSACHRLPCMSPAAGTRLLGGEVPGLDAVVWGCSTRQLPAQRGSCWGVTGASRPSPSGFWKGQNEDDEKMSQSYFKLWPLACVNSVLCFWGHPCTVTVLKGDLSIPCFSFCLCSWRTGYLPSAMTCNTQLVSQIIMKQNGTT